MSPFIKDMLERAIWTFIEGFAGVLVTSSVLDVTVIEAAALAGIMAVVSLVKSIAVSKVGAQTPQGGVNTYDY